MAQKLPLACVGDMTTTGGIVLEGANQSVRCDGKLVAQVGGKATCLKCKKGWGLICRTKMHNITVEYKPAALAEYVIDCACPIGTNRIIVPEGRFSFVGCDDGMISMNITESQSISFDGQPLTPKQVMDTMFTPTAASQTTAATNTAARAATTNTTSQAASMAEMTRQFNEPQNQEDLQRDLKAYLEQKHTQVCILSGDDTAKCILNIWNQKAQDGERFGPRLLSLLDDIRQYVEIGTGMMATSKLALALGGLGITTQEFIDADGKGRIIISSLWNDKKKFYAVVNGLNVKKNHPYLITNPTIKQLGVLSKDTIKGFKSGAIITMVVSGVINTEKLVFDSDYHLVDWFGHVGSDLFKAMTVLTVTTLAVKLAVIFELSMPILVGYLLWITVDFIISDQWKDMKVDQKLINILEENISVE